jgi:hypothetical protein
MRNTDLGSVVFPVELCPLFFEQRDGRGSGSRMVPAGDYKTVVDLERGRAVGVVGGGYHLVTNEHAIDLGKQAFTSLFESVDTAALQVFNILGPTSRSYCHVDLIHPGFTINVWKSEVYLPYIRITNSYNRSRALRFHIGFVRKLCENGVIFEKETVSFRYSHSKRDLGHSIRFEKDYAKVKRLEAQFTDYLKRLQRIEVPPEQQLPLMAKVLDVRFAVSDPNPQRQKRERERLNEFRSYAAGIAKRYTEELGSNAYAVFNAMTEYASRPRKHGPSAIHVDPLQKRIGRWANTFPTEASAGGFNLRQYTVDHQVYFN